MHIVLCAAIAIGDSTRNAPEAIVRFNKDIGNFVIDQGPADAIDMKLTEPTLRLVTRVLGLPQNL
jgi:hypothetical protein